ncbi:AI-2E family transporter [Patescibacteria group bacterium]|nr:MAG: AI-2E family transporter [Patescibacteria group bacterium]
MEIKHYNTYFFFLILAGVSLVTFLIFKPFLTAVLIAAIFAVVFQRPYQFFLRLTGGRKGFSSLFTSLLVVLVVVIPVFVVVAIIVNEVNMFYASYLSEGNFYQRYVMAVVERLNQAPIFRALNVQEAFTHDGIAGSFQSLSKSMFTVIQGVYQGMANFILWVFAMFFTLYYFLIDGKRMVSRVLHLSPLRDSHEQLIINRFISIVRATLKGTLIVGVVQGTLGGIIFAIAGIPSPVVWGILMFFFSLVPVIGTGLIWFPAGVILLLLGSIWEGLLILLVGAFIISTIDNLLRPKLVGRDTQMHPILVFFGSLGGLVVFGATGFLIGPIVVALCLTLWNIYAVEFKDQLREYNRGSL